MKEVVDSVNVGGENIAVVVDGKSEVVVAV